MTVAVLVKWARDPADVRIGPDGSISVERAAWELFEYDRVAIELATTFGERVVAFSAGAKEVDSSLARKAILSRGPEELYLVVDDRLAAADAGMTAAALAAAIEKVGDIDVIVAGAGSADNYAQQVGIQVGERLGWYTTNEVVAATLHDGTVRLRRRVEGVTDTLQVAAPVAMTLTADAASPRTPGMRDILQAGKRPTTAWSLDDLGVNVQPAWEPISVVDRGGVSRRQQQLTGSTDELVAQLLDALRREDVLEGGVA